MKRFASHLIAGACGGLIGATVYWFLLHPAPQVIEIHELGNKQTSQPAVKVLVRPESTGRETTQVVEFPDVKKTAVPPSPAVPENVAAPSPAVEAPAPAPNRVSMTAIAQSTAIQVAVRNPASKPTAPQADEIAQPAGIFTQVDQTPIPNVAAILAIMDRYDKSEWIRASRPISQTIAGLPTQQIALELGVAIAEGFIAAEAGDGKSVKEVTRAVLTLSRALGVQKAAIRRCNAITEASDKGDPALLRTELIGAASDVTQGLKELRSQDLADLVSLGGWIRGTAALSAVMQRNYDAGAEEIFLQPELAGRFQHRIQLMRPSPLLVLIATGLQDMRHRTEFRPVRRETISEVNGIADGLLRSIANQSVQQIAAQ